MAPTERYMPEVLDDLGFEMGFHIFPRRGVVERIFAWLGRNRRLCKDYEHLYTTTEALIYIAVARLMLRRLAAP